MPGRRTLAATLAIACYATAAVAQTYPSKPIKAIVPYTPGSPVDVLARVVTQQVSARLGQSIVIDNRPGAGTTIGTKLAASADPDGYTLLIGATSFILSFSLYQNLEYDPVKSFAPVAMLAYSPQVLVIAPSVPAATVQEFIAYARPIRAGSISVSVWAPCRRSWASRSRRSPALTSPASPTRAARRPSPTCWAGASR
jgi:tripartite-type tricarboxylate transporter receptor subunit TctC